MEYGKFDPSVNRKRLKILRSRLVYTIMMWSRVVVQNLTRQVEEVSVFLQAHNQSNIFLSRVQITNLEIREAYGVQNMSSHAQICLLGLQHLNLIFSIFSKV